MALLLFATLFVLIHVAITRLARTRRKTLVNAGHKSVGEDRAWRGSAQADTEAWPFQADSFRIKSK